MSGLPQAEHDRVRAALENGSAPPVEPYRLLSMADLGNLPPPAWLVSDVIRARGFNVVYGPSTAGKTFAAIDLALCVATGKPWWQGRTGESGPVLYWAAEGAYGIRQRVLAWCEYHSEPEPEAEQIRWVPDSGNLLDARSFARARATVAAMDPKPVLLVLDTLSRLMPGANENSAQDMSAFVYAVDQLREDAGDAASLVIHHTGKDGLLARGSGALENAADMMLSLRPLDAGAILTSEKAKDSATDGPWRLRRETCGESAVTVLGSSDSAIGPVELLAIRALSDDFADGEEVSTTRLKDACGISDKPGSKPSASSYYRALKRIVDMGLVTRVERSGKSNAVFYVLSGAGKRSALSGTVRALSDEADSTVTTHASLQGAVRDSSRGSDAGSKP
jgi:hypothetical protein